MAKFTIGSTEIIDDNGKIDWNKIKNAPTISGPQSVQTTYGNCSSYGFVVAAVNSTTGSVNLDLYAYGGAGYVCQCQCQCQCECSGG